MPANHSSPKRVITILIHLTEMRYDLNAENFRRRSQWKMRITNVIRITFYPPQGPFSSLTFLFSIISNNFFKLLLVS